MEQKSLPNSVAVLVLGICSIVLCCVLFGVIGITCGIIALVLSNKDKRLWEADQATYSESSYKLLKAGRVCGIIGTILSALAFCVGLIYIIFLGAAFSAIPWSQM